MAIKHVVTRGYGFGDGTKFLPTRGYTPGTAVAGQTDVMRYGTYTPSISLTGTSGSAGLVGTYTPSIALVGRKGGVNG